MRMREINFSSIGKEIYDCKNIIYGAGYNGKILYEKLSSKDVSVEAFYDDDKSRWGDIYCGRKILSRDQLMAYDKEAVNILISSMYIEQIADRIREMGFKKEYAALEMLLEKDTDTFQFFKYKNNQNYMKDLDCLAASSQDELTKQYFELIKKTVLAGKALPEITEIYCREKQYLLNCFRGKLNELNFVDAGAYTGDTVREMVYEGIHPERIFCFEADQNNYKKLKEYVDHAKCKNITCENYALWDVHTKLGIKFENYNARVDVEEMETTVESTTIDDYFQNVKIGFVKMDIEGAERKALAGGMRTIKRDRPIMAISIYHSLEDITEIPKLLMRELESYSFMVRHHSYTYSESVLYGIPKESGIL